MLEVQRSENCSKEDNQSVLLFVAQGCLYFMRIDLNVLKHQYIMQIFFSSKKHLLIIKEPQICYLKNKTSIAKKDKDTHGSGTEKKS